MLTRWVQVMLVCAALVRQGNVTALAEDRYIERVDRAGARTDEQGACGEGGVKRDVAFFVSDEPNVARARHAVDGRRELGTERVKVSKLLADKASKHRLFYEPLARLACRWSLDLGKVEKTIGQGIDTYQTIEEEAVVQRMTRVSEHQGFVRLFCGVEHELGYRFTLVLGICTCMGLGRGTMS